MSTGFEPLADAFAGGERLLLISTDAVGSRLAQHAAAIDAAVASEVEFVAYTSFLRPEEANPAGVAPEHRGTERMLRESGLEWSFLRNSIYAHMEGDNLAAALATGELVTNGGTGQVAYVSRDDCAAAATAVVTGMGHAGKTYDITGPELLDAEARAAIFAELGGKPVEVVQVDDESFPAASPRRRGCRSRSGSCTRASGAQRAGATSTRSARTSRA